MRTLRVPLAGIALGLALCVPAWLYLADWCVRFGWQC